MSQVFEKKRPIKADFISKAAPDYREYADLLYDLWVRDQQYRGNWDNAEARNKQRVLDDENLAKLEEIVENLGQWPSISMVGNLAASAAVLVAQHNGGIHTVRSEKLLNMAQELMKKDCREVDPQVLANWIDMVHLGKGEPQVYGQYLTMPYDSATYRIHTISDPQHLDDRRQSIGLPLYTYQVAKFLTSNPESKETILRSYLDIFGHHYSDNINAQKIKVITELSQDMFLVGSKYPERSTFLYQLYLDDRKYRNNGPQFFLSNGEKQKQLDQQNYEKICTFVQKYGWPRLDEYGKWGCKTPLDVLNHTVELDLANNLFLYNFLMRELAHSSEGIDLKTVTYVEDTVAIKTGKPQAYGHRIHMEDDGHSYIFPIQDVANFEKRRAEVGLEPYEVELSRNMKPYSEKQKAQIKESYKQIFGKNFVEP